MSDPRHFVITISRQLGSGGAWLGAALARQLHAAYADRDILERAAESLHVSPAEVEPMDEKAPSFFESLLETFSFGTPELGYVPPLPSPSHQELRAAEAQVIREIAARRTAVILGRGGFHVLADHPRHLPVYLHASADFRAARVERAYGVSPQRAQELLRESDASRSRGLLELTGRPWSDATQYALCLDTGALGLELATQLVLDVVRDRFGLEPAAHPS